MIILVELLKFLGLSALLIVISKFALVKALHLLGESLMLKPKIVGEISGFATSVPELLTVIASATAGLMGTGAYNILSSNVINLIQYIASVLLNKNGKMFKRRAIKIDLLLVLLTILIPALMLSFDLQVGLITSGTLFVMFFLFYIASHWSHKRYLKKEGTQLDEEILEEELHLKNRAAKILLSCGVILFSGVALYFVCTFLGDVLTNLATIFSIPQFVLGIALGFITSIPELITFFEAQRHHKDEKSDLGVVEATSNLLMSNILNLFFIFALGTLIFHFIS